MMKYIEHKIGEKIMREACIGMIGVDYQPCIPPSVIKPLPRLHQHWDEKAFGNINLPIVLEKLTNPERIAFSKKEDIRILDMPIKFPNTQYRIPQEIFDFLPVIQRVSAHEHAINPYIDEYFCYITIDRRIVKKGNATRKGGIHVDGFQGARLEKTLPIDHSYLVQDTIPTIFYDQPFEVFPGWDKTCHNYFDGFAKQVLPGTQCRYDPYTILLIDAYTLHEADIAKEDTYRTFCRLSYTVREFDRLGNAHNPLFNYNWEMHPRNTQEYLVCPV